MDKEHEYRLIVLQGNDPKHFYVTVLQYFILVYYIKPNTLTFVDVTNVNISIVTNTFAMHYVAFNRGKIKYSPKLNKWIKYVLFFCTTFCHFNDFKTKYYLLVLRLRQ